MAYYPNNPNGQNTKANSAPVVIASDDDIQSKLGVTNETAPATDTATSGLNGRLQRIAQRLTSLISLIPTALTALGNFKVAVQELPTITGSGSLAALNEVVTLTLTNGEANTVFQITGTWVQTITFEASLDNSNWTTIIAMKAGDNTTSSTATVNDLYRVTTAGFKYVRVKATSYTSGIAIITAIASNNTSGVFLNFPLPPGANTIGNIGGAVTANVPTSVTAAGNITSLNGYVELSLTNETTAIVSISGTWSQNLYIMGSIDGATFMYLPAVEIGAAGVDNRGAQIYYNGNFSVPVAGFTKIRVYNTSYTSGTAVVYIRAMVGSSSIYGSVDATIEVAPKSSMTWKSANYTTTQTGAIIWTPSASNKIAITHLMISSYGTTAGRVIIWFGASGDSTYTPGTDQLVWAGSFAPSTTAKPGAIILNGGTAPILARNTNDILRCTTDAGISLDITVYGFEGTWA